METRQRFVSLAESGHFTITELCKEFGISRKTGHKWINRYKEHGRNGLADRKSVPHFNAAKTSTEIERIIIKEKRLRPTWGPKKIHKILSVKHGIEKPPAISTVGAILKRNGFVKKRRRRGGIFKPERGHLTTPERNNHVWGVDFKGWFKLEDGDRCDPLTISDLHSRYLIKAKAVRQATQKWTKQAFRAAFRRYGLPEIIRVDNGSPFASMGPAGLSKLSVWWTSLGIRVEFSRPGCPQDNGCHERMHRTMKADVCFPPSANRLAQQQRFDRWRKDFNTARPHESLDQRFPADVYQPSAVRLDETITITLYPPSTETLLVNQTGAISMGGKSYLVGEALVGYEVAIEKSPKSNLIRVSFANVRLGVIEPVPNARLQPPASDEHWEPTPCETTDKKLD